MQDHRDRGTPSQCPGISFGVLTCSKAEEKVSDEPNGASARQIPMIVPRRDPAVFEFGR